MHPDRKPHFPISFAASWSWIWFWLTRLRREPKGILGKLFKEVESEVTQPCPTLCDPTDCSLPGSSVRGIVQARILEWIAISFSRRSSWSRVSRIVGRCFTVWATRWIAQAFAYPLFPSPNMGTMFKMKWPFDKHSADWMRCVYKRLSQKQRSFVFFTISLSARGKLLRAQSGISPIWLCIMVDSPCLISVTVGDLNGYGMNSNLFYHKYLQGQ